MKTLIDCQMSFNAQLVRRVLVLAAYAAAAFPNSVRAQTALSPSESVALYDAAYDRWHALPRAPFATYDAVTRITRRGREQTRRSTVALRARDHVCRIVGVPLDARDRADPPRVTNRCLFPDSALTFLPQAQAGAGPLPIDIATPSPETSEAPRTIAHVTARARTYDVTYAGNETVDGIRTVHLALRPYRDPGKHLVRDVWIDRSTNGVVRLHGVASLAASLASVDFFADYDEGATTQVLRHLSGFAKAQLLFVKAGADFTFDLTNAAYPATLPDALFDRRTRSDPS